MFVKFCHKIVFFASVILFCSACEICTQCVFTDSDGTIIDTQETFCGTSEDVASMEQQQQQLADSLNLELSCLPE